MSFNLGLALMWECFDPDQKNRVPKDIFTHIMRAYSRLTNNTLKENENPVEKLHLYISGGGGYLHINDCKIPRSGLTSDTDLNNLDDIDRGRIELMSNISDVKEVGMHNKNVIECMDHQIRVIDKMSRP